MNDKKRPLVIVNVAMTADGKIDSFQRHGETISSPADKIRVDQLRADSDAVLVGGRTLLDEDPKLTVKSDELRSIRKLKGLPENPTKVGVVSNAALNPRGDFLATGPARKLIYTSQQTSRVQAKLLRESGAEVYTYGDTRVDLLSAFHHMSSIGIGRLMVEGGGTLIARLLELGLVDEIYIYMAPLIFSGASSPTLADGPGWPGTDAVKLNLKSVVQIDEGGIVVHYTII